MKAAHAAWARRFRPDIYEEGRSMGMYDDDAWAHEMADEPEEPDDWRPPEDPPFNPEPEEAEDG